MYNALLNKDKTLAVIGLGYVGLPIALAFAKKIRVIGFDINEERVDLMKKGIDPSQELTASHFKDTDIHFTTNVKDLESADFYIVAVPTPIDKHKVPNLTPLIKASETIGQVISPGNYVVYESTVYPGCTEDDCLPIIEKLSGLKAGVDFKYGYSPERINPGDKVHTLESIIKVVSGNDEESLDVIAKIYDIVVDAGTYKASSVKVAEASKVIENTQRDLNISFMNELSIIFDKMGINTSEVIEAAGTKWNFLKFYPGLVGGHCIGVDPYYLTYKSKQLGYDPQVILSGRRINDGMPAYVAKKVVQLMIKAGKDPQKTKVLIMGITFKEDVSDIRNSKVVDLIQELQDYSVQVEVIDPCAEKEEVKSAYQIDLVEEPSKDYDAIIAAVKHKAFEHYNQDFFIEHSKDSPIIVDIKNMYFNKLTSELTYWTL